MPPTLGQFRWHLLLQCQIAPVGYRKSAAMSSLVQKWWSKESVFLCDDGSIVGQFWGLWESFWCQFWAILGLGGPSWGPLVSLGAILGSTSDFVTIFDQIRAKIPVHFGTHFETIMRMLTYLEPFSWCPILARIFGGILEGAMWTKCSKSLPELMF